MSARDAMAAMLDELMGPKRNASGNTTSFSFRDESVCKFALAEFCPHDLFVHTKGDLGPCPLIHDDKLRLEYQASSEYGKLGYERRFLIFLERLHDDMQFTIKKEKDKLQAQYGGGDKEKEQKEIDGEIEKTEKMAEAAGARGDVEECKKFMDKIEALRLDKTRRERIGESIMHREMEVCEICARRLIINDAPQRVEEHLTGKMHVGYIRISETIEKLKETVQKFDKEKSYYIYPICRPEREPDRRREDRDKDERRSSTSSSHRSSHRSERSDRDRGDRDRKRSRSRDRGERRESSRRDRSRDRKRSRSRSRDRRDRGSRR
ncbi:hypothetical protein PFISCL1PPCAC_12491 [Pristionchus fissidentatus]|uniref:Luc7-like protein n=1 Tax=Pristionchus fissidentatus TaxID=1538716 RepID=A0AAV5VS45_9BILA|nr:hypothetical protein PFISCL1PPCAC_12491 [Pristionchus fissidentatus]